MRESISVILSCPARRQNHVLAMRWKRLTKLSQRKLTLDKCKAPKSFRERCKLRCNFIVEHHRDILEELRQEKQVGRILKFLC